MKFFRNSKRQQRMKERFSLNFKLITSNVLIGIIPAVVVGLVVYNLAATAIMEEVRSASENQIEETGKNLDMILSTMEDVTKLLITDQELVKVVAKDRDDYDNIIDFSKERDDVIVSRFNSITVTHPAISNLMFIKQDEVIQYESDMTYNDSTFREAFFESEEMIALGSSKKNLYWYVDAYGKDGFFVIREVRDGMKKVGVLLVQIDKNYLMDRFRIGTVDPNRYDDPAYIDSLELSDQELAQLDNQHFIMDGAGWVIADMPNRLMGSQPSFAEGILKSLETEAMSGSEVIVKGYDQEQLMTYTLMDNGWIYGETIPTEQIYESLNGLKLATVLIILASGLVALVTGVSTAFNISRPLRYITDLLGGLEQGDLTVESKLEGRYEMGRLSHSFNTMVGQMHGLIGKTTNTVEEIAQDASRVETIAGQSAQASKEIMQAVESLAEGASQQATDASATYDIIQTLMDEMKETGKSFEAVMAAATRTAASSHEANTTVADLAKATANTKILNGKIQEDMGALVTQYDEIQRIVTMISGISDQTNLLALNAAIEAARAGDAGKGFAVVADEVRKLAEESATASKQIAEIVEKLHRATRQTEQQIDEGVVYYEAQETAVEATEKTFHLILTDMDAIEQLILGVHTRLSQLDRLQDQALTSTSDISSVAHASAASVEQVLATGQQQSVAAEELAQMALELGQIIEDLKGNISGFKIH